MDDNKITYTEDQFGNENITSTVRPPSYVKRAAKNGRELFFKDGKLVSKDTIPEDAIIKTFENPLPVAEIKQVEEIPVTIQDVIKSTKCIASDGNEGEFVKFINGQFINLCRDHYTNVTTGELVQLIRESVSDEQ